MGSWRWKIDSEARTKILKKLLTNPWCRDKKPGGTIQPLGVAIRAKGNIKYSPVSSRSDMADVENVASSPHKRTGCAVHHVIARGLERRKIFEDDDDIDRHEF
jgi:hypothetical protein